MKELYDDLKMELIVFDSEDDIITDSPQDTGNDNTNESGDND